METNLSARWAHQLSIAFILLASLGHSAPSATEKAEKAARDLEAHGSVVATVDGQRRRLQLAPREIALPRAGAAAPQLPPGAERRGEDVTRHYVRLAADVPVSRALTAARVEAETTATASTLSALRVAPVFYEAGRGNAEAARYVATTDLLVVGVDRTSAEAFALQTGAAGLPTAVANQLWLLRYASAYEMLEAAAALEKTRVRIEPQFARLRKPRTAPNDPLYGQQVYFKNTGQGGGTAGVDLNIEGLWPAASGTGITVAVVDDGLEITHPDLAPNVATDTSLHANVLQGGSDPTPPAESNHGTICAGFIAARGNNGIGMTGAAPLARLLGVRLLGGAVTDTQEAQALGWRTDVVSVSSNSWGPDDDGKTVSGPGTATLTALKDGVTSGRGGRGVVYVVAAGNGRGSGDYAGYDGYSGSRYVIAVGATDNTGQQAPFSESGPQVLVAAIGQTSDTSDEQLLATDNIGPRGANTSASPDGDYTTSGTQGTSYSTPQVAGLVALMLEANPQLGWRDVKEILLRTARKTDAGDSDWITNGGGFSFNHKYGAGFADAAAAVALARTWTNLRTETSATQTSTATAAIPDNNPAGVARSLTIAPATNLRVETVEVTVSVSHANRGQLRFELTSPAGTVTVLGLPRTADTTADLDNWTFSTPRHWGESGSGNWTVKVIDTVAGGTGTLTAAAVTVYGTAEVPVAPTITTQPQARTVTAGANVTLVVAASGTPGPAYQWKKNGADLPNATAATLALANVQAADAGDYTVVVSNTAGSVTSTTATLTVNPVPSAPTITAAPASATIASGQTLTLSVTAAGTAPLTYQWYQGISPNTSAPIAGATASSYVTPALTATTAYWVRVSNSAGQVDSTTANVTVASFAPTVALTAETGAAYLTTGGTTTLRVRITYTGQLPLGIGASIALPTGWTFGTYSGPSAANQPAAGDNQLAWSYTTIPANEITFTFTASYPAGQSGDKSVTGAVTGSPGNVSVPFTALTLTPATPAAISTQPLGKLAAVQTGTTLTVAATGSGALGYQWKKNGAVLTGDTRITGTTTATLSLANLTVGDTGSYTVEVTNAFGSVTSNAAVLTVIDAGATQAVVGEVNFASGAVTITQTISYATTPLELRWQMLVPTGWSYASGAGTEGDVKPSVGATSLLEWSWTTIPASPVTFTTTLNVPAGDTTAKNLTSLAVLRTAAGTLNVTAKPDPLIISQVGPHSADVDRNYRISLLELTRLIELYNTRFNSTRTGCYKVEAGTEDGFGAEPTRTAATSVTLSRYHSADSNRDGKLSLLELTRLIELYNYRSGTSRTGQYHIQAGTEDGYASGP